MEIIEHVLLDPCHVFREASRVLSLGGEFIVTTPNIASYESLQKLANMESPYSFGIYSKHGAYGRHNREYVPNEVALLGNVSAFETAILTTKDLYPYSCDTSAVRQLFSSQPGEEELRRQNIFYKGIKSDRNFSSYPGSLYDFDPSVHRASISVDKIKTDLVVGERIAGQVTLENEGSYTWENAGDDVTRLGVILADVKGNPIARDFRKIALPDSVKSQEKVTFDFDIEGNYESGEYILRFDMVHERVCWFSELSPNYVDVNVNFEAV